MRTIAIDSTFSVLMSSLGLRLSHSGLKNRQTSVKTMTSCSSLAKKNARVVLVDVLNGRVRRTKSFVSSNEYDRPSRVSMTTNRRRTRRETIVASNGFDEKEASNAKNATVDANKEKESYQSGEKFSNETKLRSEAQAPFRVARQFLFASCALSASIGFGIALIQLVTGLLGAANRLPFEQSVQNVGIDGISAALFIFLWRKDEEQKQKQMSRIGREERLGGLKVELTTGKIVRMQSLRGFSRVVLFAGNKEYLESSLQSAELYREELISKGVFLVPVPLDDEKNTPTVLEKPNNAIKDERKFRGTAVNVSQKDGWKDWIIEQKKMANIKDPEVGVYVGLRMDGRVRASGKGIPPFDRFAEELPPVEGAWGSTIMNGFDGRVGVDD